MKGLKEVLLFDSPQAHGFCPREKSCPFSHDVDDVLDREWKARESKRQKRKRKQKSSGDGCGVHVYVPNSPFSVNMKHKVNKDMHIKRELHMNTDPKTKNIVTFPALDLHQFVCLSLFKEQMYFINDQPSFRVFLWF